MGGQGEVLMFLKNPASYGPGVGGVEKIETHAAYVFLAGTIACKIKRAVRFPYLDFSSLEKRRAALQRELELNRPSAPQIYDRLVAITRTSTGRLDFDGEGEVVEWALWMKRFDEDMVLAWLAEKGPLDPLLADRLADVVAASHAGAHVVNEGGGGMRVLARALQIARDLERRAVEYAPGRVHRLETLFARRFADVREMLARRGLEGHVRRCHGDLHLENIVLIAGEPVLFDALEFSEDLATGDVLYDLAFLVMDLVAHGDVAAARRVLERYLWKVDDFDNYEGLAAFGLFMAMRAGVRAIVAADRARVIGHTGKADVAGKIAGYVDLALSCIETQKPLLVAIGGFSGTGKTVVSRNLAPRLGAVPGAIHLRSDLERKAMFHVDETTRLAPDAYDKSTSVRVYDRVFLKARKTLESGYCVVADAVFSTAEERAAIEQVARVAGAEFAGIWLDVDEAVAARRIAARRGDASDATIAVLEQQRKRGAGDIAWQRLDASSTVEEAVDAVVRYIARHRPQDRPR